MWVEDVTSDGVVDDEMVGGGGIMEEMDGNEISAVAVDNDDGETGGDWIKYLEVLLPSLLRPSSTSEFSLDTTTCVEGDGGDEAAA